MDGKLTKWISWIRTIHEDTEDLLLNKYIHSRYLEIIKANIEIQSPPNFHQWVVRNYGSYVVMAIRRQLDIDTDVVSLKRLLLELKEYPHLLTKTWHRSLYRSSTNSQPINMEAYADVDFKKNAGNLEYFDPVIAETDIEKLDTLGKAITRYANKNIAHRTSMKVTLTFSEINEFLEEFESIVKKYILLLTASGYSSLTPTFQYDWESIFTKVWIKPHADSNN